MIKTEETLRSQHFFRFAIEEEGKREGRQKRRKAKEKDGEGKGNKDKCHADFG